MDEHVHEHAKNIKCSKKKYHTHVAQSLPIITGTFAAMLTEGKTVKEMETIALLFSALANDIFLIAAIKSKHDIFYDAFDII